MPRLSARKRAANVSLSSHLLDEARALGVNVSQACERGLEEEIRATRGKAWLEANRAALYSSNDFVDRHGLPLARHRQF